MTFFGVKSCLKVIYEWPLVLLLIIFLLKFILEHFLFFMWKYGNSWKKNHQNSKWSTQEKFPQQKFRVTKVFFFIVPPRSKQPRFVVNSVITIHLKIKKLSTNSPRDFNSILDTINHYWITPAKYFPPNTSSLSTLLFQIKDLKTSRIKKPLLISQFFIARNFVAWSKKIPSL